MSLKFGMPLAALALVLGGTAMAAGVAETIAARQANFKALGKASKGVRDAAGQSDAAAMKANADALVAAAGKVGGYFPAGSGAESGVSTKALPTIWQNKAGFAKAVADLNAAAKAVQAAAAKGDAAGVNGALTQLGGACKACHEQFRAK